MGPVSVLKGRALLPQGGTVVGRATWTQTAVRVQTN